MEKLSSALRTKIVDALGGVFYGGGTIKIYTGTQPATADTAPTGTLIVTIDLPSTPWAAGVVGVAPKSGIWSGVAVASADFSAADAPGWFRKQTAGSTHPVDGVIGAVGSGAELELAPLVITSGQTVSIGSGTLTQPAS